MPRPKFKVYSFNKENENMKDQAQDIAVRAAKTFIQTFIASLAVATQTDFSNYKAILIAAVSAGVSAAWNSLLAVNANRK